MTNKNSNKISEAEKAEFQAEMVKMNATIPLPPTQYKSGGKRDRQLTAKPPQNTSPTALKTHDAMLYKNSGLQSAQLDKLKRGKLPPTKEFDLHGMDIQMAETELRDFINDALKNNIQVVKVIHGKGYHSQGQPKLKNYLNEWLRQWNEILGFCSAPKQDGGTGAIYVLLKK